MNTITCVKNEQQEESKLCGFALIHGTKRNHQMKTVVGNQGLIQQLFFQQGENRL